MVAIAAVTGFLIGGQAIDVHVWAGVSIGFLVFLRLIWGFVGGPFARFSGFVVGPNALIKHLHELRRNRAPRHLGHNPLGGLMILVLLVTLVALIASGTMLLGGIFRTGPFRSLLSFDTGRIAAQGHQVIAFGLMGLVAAHIAGALYESRRTRQNLVLAMITGAKRPEPGVSIPPFRPRPIVAILLTVIGAAALLAICMPLASRPFQGMPVKVDGTAYATACSDCHAVFHPSLLPSASWSELMGTLDDHFGEDATISSMDQAGITEYLIAGAAEQTDTKPGHVFRQVDAVKPFEIAASPFWRRTHAKITEDIFASPSVGSKANCSACHSDAVAGWFYPGQVEIPDSAQGANP